MDETVLEGQAYQLVWPISVVVMDETVLLAVMAHQRRGSGAGAAARAGGRGGSTGTPASASFALAMSCSCGDSSAPAMTRSAATMDGVTGWLPMPA